MIKAPSTEPIEKNPGTKPRSFLRALLSGLVVFVLFAGLLEGVCRLGWADNVLPMRSVGNYHTQFETKWFKLEEYVRQNGGVDVILLGNLQSDDQHLGQLGKLLGVSALLSGVPTTVRGASLLDNILLDRRATSEFTGRAEVVDMMREFELTMPGAQQVSDHLPIWAEFSAYEGGRR